MKKGVFHVHSVKSFDGLNSFSTLTDFVKKNQLDFIILTGDLGIEKLIKKNNNQSLFTCIFCYFLFNKLAIVLSLLNLGILFCPPNLPIDFIYFSKACFVIGFTTNLRNTLP